MHQHGVAATRQKDIYLCVSDRRDPTQSLAGDIVLCMIGTEEDMTSSAAQRPAYLVVAYGVSRASSTDDGRSRLRVWPRRVPFQMPPRFVIATSPWGSGDRIRLRIMLPLLGDRCTARGSHCHTTNGLS